MKYALCSCKYSVFQRENKDRQPNAPFLGTRRSLVQVQSSRHERPGCRLAFFVSGFHPAVPTGGLEPFTPALRAAPRGCRGKTPGPPPSLRSESCCFVQPYRRKTPGPPPSLRFEAISCPFPSLWPVGSFPGARCPCRVYKKTPLYAFHV